ncbi:MAG TPA: ABC transporter ATP-binding protein, partial [Pyrinomonadaceae bacterium]|nr:ABC transporter ATP-binding protein [Pyrinomonadaceae bacterium]
MSHLLEVRNLRTHFPTRAGLVRAVDGVSFHIDRGELLGLVGESGCGKSITALSVMRLIAPPGRIAGGEILFEGENLLAASEERMREIRGDEIAMIFQDPMTSLNPVFTVGEQIAEALRLHRKLNRKQAREAAVEAMREVAIPDPGRRVDDYPHQLSGGMRQRVMIAMALACDPKLLIADEPTTALDVTIQAQILELLNELRKGREL